MLAAQNRRLLGDKLTAYENQRLNEQVQRELDDQR
jgi:hypothetical protein